MRDLVDSPVNKVFASSYTQELMFEHLDPCEKIQVQYSTLLIPELGR